MKLCACLTGKTAKDCIAAAKKIDADFIEHRMDYMDDFEGVEEIYRSLRLPVIATNRPLGSGGRFKGSERERIVLLLKAIYAGCAYVDIEIETDHFLMQKVIDVARQHECKVIISMHDFRGTPSAKELVDVMHKQKELGADIGKVVTTAKSMKDCNKVLDLLKAGQKEKFPLVAFSMGEIGKFTRLMSMRCGSPFTYVAVDEATAPGQFHIDEMRDKVKGMNCKLLMIIGDPIGHTLSPVMQNAALKDKGLDHEFDYRKSRVKKNELGAYVALLRAGEIYGGNVTIPHKEDIIAYLDKLTKEAELIGAVNTLYVKDNLVVGHNTDGIGAYDALMEVGFDPKGKKILLLGAGGGARAVAFVLALKGAKEIVVLNRTLERAKFLAKEVHEKTGVKAAAYELTGMEKEIKNADLLINLTSVGMKGHAEGESLVDPKLLHKNIAVMDIVYTPYKTKLLKDAENKGCKVIPGIGMLVYQGVEGFKLWTKKKPNVKAMKKALEEELK